MENNSNPKFTPRNVQLLRLISEGLSSKEIASQLSLTTGTVEIYRKNLLKKTKTKNSSQLICYGFRTGVIK